jgi:peroxiredoxin
MPNADFANAGRPQLTDLLLHDVVGKPYSLSEVREPVLVVVFITADCPLAKLYAPRLAELARAHESQGVRFLAIGSSRHDRPEDLARYARAHALPFPVLRDVGARAAHRFRATRSPEAFVLDASRQIRYSGRIDDQHSVGTHRPAAAHHELADAVHALLAGGPVAVPRTEAPGCPIAWPLVAPPSGQVTYCRDVAPILRHRCEPCHHPGQAAPFALTTYEEAVGWASAVREVVEDRRMPPWSANPAHGKFANDPSLAEYEKQALFAWIDGGCPHGDPRELPPPAQYQDGWTIPTPDLVVTMPSPFTVQAQGVIEYQYIRVHPGFTEDRWVRAAEIRPGNRAVVHHCAVYLQRPGDDSPQKLNRVGDLESFNLTMYHPGTGPLLLPEGAAKRIPAGWRIVFVMHYQAIGSVQEDRTELGLVFIDPGTVKQEAATVLVYDPDLRIPPRANNHRVAHTWTARHNVRLVALTPHMHLRGRSFQYELLYPDGREEVLLDVPRFDVTWQHRYVLAQPLPVPAGSVIRCTAIYDNSADNPLNPNPDAEVRTGIQTWEEMFNGFLEVIADEEDLSRERAHALERRLLAPLTAVGISFAAAVFLVGRRLRGILRRSRGV